MEGGHPVVFLEATTYLLRISEGVGKRLESTVAQGARWVQLLVVPVNLCPDSLEDYLPQSSVAVQELV